MTTLALDVPKEEARFLTKLDLTLISASALGVMCRYLDQVNITNAFSMPFHAVTPGLIPFQQTPSIVPSSYCSKSQPSSPPCNCPTNTTCSSPPQRQRHERRSETVRQRTQLRQRRLERRLCIWANPLQPTPYPRQCPALYCLSRTGMDGVHFCHGGGEGCEYALCFSVFVSFVGSRFSRFSVFCTMSFDWYHLAHWYGLTVSGYSRRVISPLSCMSVRAIINLTNWRDGIA